MKTAVICVGDELLKGFTVNTNLTALGGELLKIGITADFASTIPDSTTAISSELDRLISGGFELIILSGGLGPTLDDLTKQVVAETLGRPLYLSDDVLDTLRRYWENRGVPMPESARRQALVPEGAEWLPNDVGTAPGLVLNVNDKGNGCLVVMLPGPPGEFVPMVANHLIPYLSRNLIYDKRFTRTLVVADMPESTVEKMTERLIPDDMSIAYCASPSCVKVHISGPNQEALESIEREIRGVLGNHALPAGVESPAESLLRELRVRAMTLAVAESCTGGMLASELTSFPGASDVLKGGLVVYSNELKTKLLNVPRELLERFGAVSSECAEAMVENLVDALNVDAGIAITGVAGPGGGTPDKPVGLVHIGVAFDGDTLVTKHRFAGDRARVRQRALHTSVNSLLALIRKRKQHDREAFSSRG